MNSASVYTFFPPLFSGLTTNFVNPGYPNLDQMKGKGFPILLNKTVQNSQTESTPVEGILLCKRPMLLCDRLIWLCPSPSLSLSPLRVASQLCLFQLAGGVGVGPNHTKTKNLAYSLYSCFMPLIHCTMYRSFT
jgi:hypothetical protein